MKHAYLIIAHNEFEVLKLLISKLDDERNDIYVHIDKKVKTVPVLSTKKSRLHILDKRIDVRWGHVSQIETELLLFETALANAPYSYYHLISGTHMPLKSQDEIHEYFSRDEVSNMFVSLGKDIEYQETLKMRRINLFLRNYLSKRKWEAALNQFLWKVLIRIQKVVGFELNRGCDFLKASNWVSLTECAVRLLVDRKMRIMHRYRFSFCGDEFFIPSELNDSPLAGTVENRDDILFVEMGRSNPRTFKVSELESLKQTGCLFARKFTI